MNNINFDQWQLLCTLPYQAEFSKHMQEGSDLPNLTNWFPATVPGSVQKDLQNAGLIQDPYFGQNSLNCEWVENRWWVYKTKFKVTSDDAKDTLKLCFKGIDYSAQIYLNGHLLGKHEGMYLPFESIVNDYVLIDKENVLVCVIEHAPFADPQPGYTSKTKYMKARFNYKWDFATRLVNLGLYDEVTLTKHCVASIAHSYVHTTKIDDDFNVTVELDLDGYVKSDVLVHVDLAYHNDTITSFSEDFAIDVGTNKFSTTFKVANPKLWFPNGYGEQSLYDLSVKIIKNEIISDQKDHTIGFKTLEYIHADGREDALPYSIVINGKRMFIKGTNVVPFCSLQGSITYDTLRAKLKEIKDCNVNLVRIWGGGHIESENFYNLCDEFGLMIWQEFTMCSSGCDDVPSKDENFVDLLHKVAVYNVKLKRNHTSLVYWCGGNELTDWNYLGRPDHEAHPATFEDKTLAMLKGIVDTFSPNITMLPCSASGPNALLKIGDIGNNHDVHGPWGYIGVSKHYDFYNNSDSIVHGEFGCGGLSNLETLEKFIAPKDLKLQTSNENQVWRHHSSGWECYSIREEIMFGNLRNIPFEDYIKVTQFIQAESLRYSLESNRRRQWKCVGEMTWQFNEPWPNIQCSNVVDYYGGKKLAYYFMRDAYADVLTSLKYDKLFYSASEDFTSEIFIINDNKSTDFTVEYTVKTTDNNLIISDKISGIASEDISTKIGEINFKIPEKTTGGFIINLKTICRNSTSEKEYLMLIADKNIPVILSPETLLELENGSELSNGIDSLRADYIPVVEYVNSVLSKV